MIVKTDSKNIQGSTLIIKLKLGLLKIHGRFVFKQKKDAYTTKNF